VEAQVTSRLPRVAGSTLLLAPALLVLLLLFIAPILLLLSRSVFDPTFTLRHYSQIALSPEYLQVLWISFKISALSTLACLAFGYPAAYVIAHSTGTARSLLLGLVLLPFWTNILVRCYAWIIVLQTRGVINLTLVDGLHILSEPLPLVFNLAGVIIGMVHYLLPPTILILDSVMRTVDHRLLSAAQSLGATPRQAFFRIYVPLTMPGIRAAVLLIFIMGLGFFVTPALLGGRRELTVAMLINHEFTELIDWGFGSALAVVLLLVTLLGLYGYYLTQSGRKGVSASGVVVHA
jgi:putative spermidine/putrescine transport system permease protein